MPILPTYWNYNQKNIMCIIWQSFHADWYLHLHTVTKAIQGSLEGHHWRSMHAVHQHAFEHFDDNSATNSKKIMAIIINYNSNG